MHVKKVSTSSTLTTGAGEGHWQHALVTCRYQKPHGPGYTPNQLNQKFLGWEPGLSFCKNNPGDSGMQPALRTTVIGAFRT